MGRGDECSPQQSHREAIKDLFKVWIQAPGDLKKAHSIEDKIAAGIKNDFLIKQNEFTQYNTFNLKLDDRGLMDLPYEVLFMSATRPDQIDRESFSEELLMVDALAHELGLKNEDFSTVTNRTTGIFHVRSALSRVPIPRGPLYEDEQLVKGIYDSLVALQSPLVKETSNLKCETLKSNAENEIKQLSLPDSNEGGVFYH